MTSSTPWSGRSGKGMRKESSKRTRRPGGEKYGTTFSRQSKEEEERFNVLGQLLQFYPQSQPLPTIPIAISSNSTFPIISNNFQ